MTTTNTTIDVEEFGSFLKNLIGLDVKATEDASLTCEKFGVLASYVDEAGDVKGQILCDLPAAAMLGAALTQVPMGAVEDAVESGNLPDNLRENVEEVMNIAVNVFPSTSGRLVLKEVTAEGETPALDGAVAVKLEIQRYGNCCMFIFCS